MRTPQATRRHWRSWVLHLSDPRSLSPSLDTTKLRALVSSFLEFLCELRVDLFVVVQPLLSSSDELLALLQPDGHRSTLRGLPRTVQSVLQHGDFGTPTLNRHRTLPMQPPTAELAVALPPSMRRGSLVAWVARRERPAAWTRFSNGLAGGLMAHGG